MKRILTVCAVLGVGCVQAEMRTWTDYDGTKIQAELEQSLNGKVTLRSAEGKSLQVSISSLSADDQKYVLRQTPPDVDIDMHDTSDSHSVGGGARFDFDRTTYEFRLELEKESGIAYSGSLTAESYIIGYREVKGEYFLLKKSEDSFSFADEDSVEIHLGVVSLSEVGGNIEAGTEYAGYLVVLLDDKGRVFQTEGSRSKFEEHARIIRKQSVDSAVSGSELLPLAAYGGDGYLGPNRNRRGHGGGPHR